MDPIDSAIAEAELQFARAARENDNWRQFKDTNATPPWWPVGVECSWTLIGPDDEFWTSLSPNDYRAGAVGVLTELARRVFDSFLAPYQKRVLPQLGTSEAFRDAFADYVVCELLPRVAERVLNTPAPAREIQVDCQPEASDAGRVEEPELGPTKDHADQRLASDAFGTQDQREKALVQAGGHFGSQKAVAKACGVDYRDLRTWARSRQLAKGPSKKVERIEETLLPFCRP
jgi:hypothetical protein